MAFYNMQAGDVPVFKSLADQYSISDNFHQSFMGGTGANHFMLGTGDAIFWTDVQGLPQVIALCAESELRTQALLHGQQ
jgi:phospholipase C